MVAGNTYSFRIPMGTFGGSITNNSEVAIVRWINSAWASFSTTNLSNGGGLGGAYTSTGTVTAPAGAVAALVYVTASSVEASTIYADAWTAVEESSIPSAYVSPTNSITRDAHGIYTITNGDALSDLTAETGRWLGRVQAWLNTGVIIDWYEDANNYLRLDLTSTTVRLTRNTAGTSQSATVTRPARATEFVVQADWSATELRVSVYDDGWTTGTAVASTTWPDLTATDWIIGQSGAATLTMNGRIAWFSQDTNSQADASTWQLMEEPQPFDWADADGLGWLWTSTNPLRLIEWREGGYASVTGQLLGGSTPTLVHLIPIASGGEWHRGALNVSIDAVPRLRYLRGA